MEKKTVRLVVSILKDEDILILDKGEGKIALSPPELGMCSKGQTMYKKLEDMVR